MTPAAWRLLGVDLASGVCLWWLFGSAASALGGARSWDALETWYRGAPPATILLALGWSIALLTAGWLAVAAGLQLVAQILPTLRLRHAADLISPAFVRRLARGGATLSLAVGLTVGGAGAAGAQDEPGTASMERLEESPTTTGDPSAHAVGPTTTTGSTTTPPTTISSTTTPPSTIPSSGVPPGSPTTVPLPAQTSGAATVAPRPPAPPALAAPSASLSESPVGETHVVVAGDSFWSIAVDVLSASVGRPGDRALVAYWQRLIDANRADLVVPSNPDLIYPGQVMVLPPA